MGYTHYWHRPEELDEARWEEFVADAARLFSSLTPWMARQGREVLLCGAGGIGEPQVTRRRVACNGDGEDAHEGFVVERVLARRGRAPMDDGLYFEFCKTARKPYDVVVTAMLMALKLHYPEVRVFSDGDAADWKPGREFVAWCLGRVPNDGPWSPARAEQCALTGGRTQ